MEELFGIPMDNIMLTLLALFGVSGLGVISIYVTNPVMFRMGVRNLRRRGLQSVLVVVGLMLATLITTAAFTTGDTVDHSISRAGYQQLQRSDLQLNFVGDTSMTNDIAVYFADSATEALDQRFTDGKLIDGFLPLLQEPVAVVNGRTGLSEPSIILSGVDARRLDDLGGLRLVDGGTADVSALQPDEILLSKRAAESLDAVAGDVLTVSVNGTPSTVRVAGIVDDELASSGSRAFYEHGAGGGAMLLSSVQQMTGHAGQINRLTIALHGDVATSHERSDEAIDLIQPFLQSPEGAAVLGTTQPVVVEALKADAVAQAEQQGNLFTTFFLVLGLFSIAAGVMLIFMIFVMLAAERKAEIGMARAVGAQRANLMQSFIAEGMVYSLLAGAVGTAAGVIASLSLVSVFLKVAGGFDFIEPSITVRSLVISYCLGVVITFLTVTVSSYKVSRVNIVAAIRGTDEEPPRPRKRQVSWRWVAVGIPAMIVPPLGLWWMLRKGFGVPSAWVVAPVGVALGALSVLVADHADSQFLFSLGVSLVPLSVAVLAAHYEVSRRVTWTLVGAFLSAYWLAPISYDELIFGHALHGSMEMFLLSGIMVVVSFTLMIVFNAQLLTKLVQRGHTRRYTASAVLVTMTAAALASGFALGDRGNGLGQLLFLLAGVTGIGAAVALAAVRFPHLAPALKMGIAYPLSNRFRTGMTIAMFSLIVFSLATFGAINASFVSMMSADGGDGGWDVLVSANRNTVGGADLRSALVEEDAPVASSINAVGRTTIFTGRSTVRVANGADQAVALPVIAADDSFLSLPQGSLAGWANGYEDEQAVFDAVRTGSHLALVDRSVIADGFNDYDFTLKDLKIEDDRFDPVQLELFDAATGRSEVVTVIGVLGTQLEPTYTTGVYLNERDYRATFGQPDYLRTWVRLDDHTDPEQAAHAIEGALVRRGLQAESIDGLLEDAAAESNTFILMFQGFMGLGLLTGIAALGVIAFRSVVERRQQIGMLRAIGYQPGTVALSFMLESGFIALMGILSGVVGGMVIAHNLFSSGQFASSGAEFAIPWGEVLLIAGASFAMALLMTWWPSRQAAAVPVAEALRYE
ncbi:MAG: FtsX-like permease family protein [Dehalococcoidia bacterium]|nr:FtsX-like permease family protein [Dehalococcoidia bacterium]